MKIKHLVSCSLTKDGGNQTGFNDIRRGFSGFLGRCDQLLANFYEHMHDSSFNLDTSEGD